jgi:tRNA threonylcarbamoyladenosine biosynthesis protein TsaB
MTSRILCIDTSLDVCSVALASGINGEACLLEEKGFNIHSARLTLMIEDVVKNAGLGLHDLDAICISKGPGSYTGLRIGVSTAKGLCYALGKPLISINTLQLMAFMALREMSPDGKDALYCPLVDARRMEVYYALFDTSADFVQETKAAIVDDAFLNEMLAKQQVIFFGNGTDKCRSILEKHANASFLPRDIYPRADYMAQPALAKFTGQQFEDLFSFEPFYLKDFYMINNQ